MVNNVSGTADAFISNEGGNVSIVSGLNGSIALNGHNLETLLRRLDDLEQQQQQATHLSIPTGTILAFSGSNVPTGFLPCDGIRVDREQYANLFAVIGTTYGAGDLTTNFNVPDLRGRVVAGEDSSIYNSGLTNRLQECGSSLGMSCGAEKHSLTVSQLPPHSHGLYEGTNGYSGGSSPNRPLVNHQSSAQSVTSNSMDSTGDGEGHSSVQPTLVLKYIIKF